MPQSFLLMRALAKRNPVGVVAMQRALAAQQQQASNKDLGASSSDTSSGGDDPMRHQSSDRYAYQLHLKKIRGETSSSDKSMKMDKGSSGRDQYPEMHEWLHWESVADSVNKESHMPEYKQASSDFKENEQGNLGGMSKRGGIAPAEGDSKDSTRVGFDQSNEGRNYNDF